jgi:hypothetical protein
MDAQPLRGNHRRQAMLRTHIFLAIVLSIAAIGSVAAPAAEYSSQVFGGANEQISAHFRSVHERTTVGMSRYRFRGKKK